MEDEEVPISELQQPCYPHNLDLYISIDIAETNWIRGDLLWIV